MKGLHKAAGVNGGASWMGMGGGRSGLLHLLPWGRAEHAVRCDGALQGEAGQGDGGGASGLPKGEGGFQGSP